MNNEIQFIDTTLRDGSHYLKHQFTLDFIAKYCKHIDTTGIDTVIVGHGNGLGASSIQIGISKHSDEEILKIARANLKQTKLGVYMIPGLGTIEDNLIMAADIGVSVFKIGSHCTEADTTKQHISYLAKKSFEVYGCLMLVHMISAEDLLEQAMKLESYGANGVILFDSAGALLPDDLKKKISLLKEKLKIPVGIHTHNNLGLAISNSLLAYELGATIFDGTLKGFGAGAGNCQLEALIAILQKKRTLPKIDFYKLLDTAELMVEKELNYPKGINNLSIISGLSGVFSAFSEKVKQAAEQFQVDSRDIFIELGNRKVVGGQEDIIIDVAMNLAQKKKKDDESYMIESLL